MNTEYRKQVELLIKLLPIIAKEEVLALHGGTAINLFIKEMPRLSVDIDLTYTPIKERKNSLHEIKQSLLRIRKEMKGRFPNIKIQGPTKTELENKLLCNLHQSQVKIEVNTVIRGAIEPPKLKFLNEIAQKEFNLYAEIHIVPFSQLYGGKICAALDRQHPRDIFDVWKLPIEKGIDDELKFGFIFSLLSSARPIHELLNPTRLDHSGKFKEHFEGMIREPFTYEDYEEVRELLIKEVNDVLTKKDKEFLVGFANAKPNWEINSFIMLRHYPSVKWKLENLKLLRANSPGKHKEYINLLIQHFKLD